MPTTRKKVNKTVYKLYEDEDSEGETGDFSDSGSEAKISEPASSDEEELEENRSSADEFDTSTRSNRKKQPVKRKPKFAKQFINKINKQIAVESEENDVAPTLFTVKDLTDEDKLLPSVLNLSESDSSDDDTPKAPAKKNTATIPSTIQENTESSGEDNAVYTDVWSYNIIDNSAEIAKQTFMELEQHKNTVEETKATLQNYAPTSNIEQKQESNVKDLLALGEEVTPQKSTLKKKTKPKRIRNDSDSEVEDWEEVKESKSIPQQGLQLLVELPDSICRKTKKIDVEMMMKRKINRVKKEHQVFMHKVHVLCWLGHGNYLSQVLNNQEVMAAILAMVPKGCYPDNRLDMKYLEQITMWFKDKLILKPDKYENKFRPKAPPLKKILLDQIKSRVVTAKKNTVFLFVTMLRALGLQCRIMFNFVTVPLRPPSSELCSLATKPQDDKIKASDKKEDKPKQEKGKGKTSAGKAKTKSSKNLPQVDGNDDSFSCDSDFENLLQVDGNDDTITTKTRSMRSTRLKKAEPADDKSVKEEGASPPKRPKRNTVNNSTDILGIEKVKKRVPATSPKRKNITKSKVNTTENDKKSLKVEKVEILKSPISLSLNRQKKPVDNDNIFEQLETPKLPEKSVNTHKTRHNSKITSDTDKTNSIENSKTIISTKEQNNRKLNPPEIVIGDLTETNTQSRYFENLESGKDKSKVRLAKKRSHSATVDGTKKPNEKIDQKTKTRTKSATGSSVEKSKYFDIKESETKKPKLSTQQLKKQEKLDDLQRVSHKDLTKSKPKPKNDVTGDLVDIIKNRIKTAKEEAKKGIVKGKVKAESDDDSDYLPVEDPNHHNLDSDEDFKPTQISPKAPILTKAKPSTSKKIDRRVLSSDDETTKHNKVDVWCEVFVEELEQWIAVDVIKGKVHCTGDLYSHATHPVCYVVGWDNNNYLKDLTRRYVPHWNTVTRKQRAEPGWWKEAVEPWLGPKTARDREEDEALDRMQLEAPLPKSIAEYKNHPLYALKRHLLKFQALYPPDAATLGFVRNEPVYARECVYTCRSRDTWLKEAKVVKLGEKPYKVVKARPKWDKLSNKLITDKPLEVFGPWQVQDYEPPIAENGIVPRNAYGNVELFKDCMLPKGTVHIKLPGLNKVARKLNIDCAPAMTGFDFNGGWSHPVYDGFVVCKEFEEIITEAWVKDQEEQERREREKIELRVYGNWKRLIKGLLIRERLKLKYGFEEPSTSQAAKNKSKGPRLVVKKTS